MQKLRRKQEKIFCSGAWTQGQCSHASCSVHAPSQGRLGHVLVNPCHPSIMNGDGPCLCASPTETCPSRQKRIVALHAHQASQPGRFLYCFFTQISSFIARPSHPPLTFPVGAVGSVVWESSSAPHTDKSAKAQAYKKRKRFGYPWAHIVRYCCCCFVSNYGHI